MSKENQAMKIRFITGNTGKFNEAQNLLPELEQLKIDLPEIQSLDASEIIEAKLDAAAQQVDGPIMVEDTSLYCNCINGLPGPMIKWFLESLGNDNLVDLIHKYNDHSAAVKTIIGLRIDNQNHFFEGNLEGSIVQPRGTNGFGWCPIFQVKGMNKTYAELETGEKNKISQRAIAIKKMTEFLETRNDPS